MNDKELLQFCEDFRDGILNGRSSDCMCFVVCAPLQGLLSVHGVKSDLVEIDLPHPDYEIANHFFLQLGDGRILDPTADQFGGTAVYLGDALEYHKAAAE